MSDEKTVQITVAADCPAGLSAQRGGRGYALTPGEKITVPVSVAVGLVGSPFVSVPKAIEKLAETPVDAEPDDDAEGEPDGAQEGVS